MYKAGKHWLFASIADCCC
nr:KxYKxGKxW signal peptide domain-containing protein [Fructobacillus cardui]